MTITNTPFSTSRKAIRETFITQLENFGLKPKTRREETKMQLTVCDINEGKSTVSVKLLCPTSFDDKEIKFPLDHIKVQRLQQSLPWHQPEHSWNETYTNLSISGSDFLAIPVPESDGDFWLIASNEKNKKLFFSITSADQDTPETEFALRLTADVDGVQARQILHTGLKDFKCLKNALKIRSEEIEVQILKFSLAELEDELRSQLLVITTSIAFHFNVAMAAHLTGDIDYSDKCHNKGNGRSLHWVDDLSIVDLEDYAITFQVRRLYALVFDNFWDNLISGDSNVLENIDHAIDTLDEFISLTKGAPGIHWMEKQWPVRLTSLSLMAKARRYLLGKKPIPIPEFAALSQIGERSITNHVSRNGALYKARVTFAGNSCIDPMKALKWIDKRPLFHRATDKDIADKKPIFLLLTCNYEAIQELIAEIFKKMTLSIAEGKTINEYFSEHGYSENGASCLRRGLKGDYDWFFNPKENFEDNSDEKRDLLENVQSDIEDNYPDFPDRKKWLWAIRMFQYYG